MLINDLLTWNAYFHIKHDVFIDKYLLHLHFFFDEARHLQWDKHGRSVLYS